MLLDSKQYRLELATEFSFGKINKLTKQLKPGCHDKWGDFVRIIVAECAVDYSGRLTAHLPQAKRVLMIKGDGSILVHADGGSYKPINWMSPPCSIASSTPSSEQREQGITEVWTVCAHKTDDKLVVSIFQIFEDIQADLGEDPGIQKDGVEAHIQKLLSEQVDLVEAGAVLVRREFPTAIGPVDLMLRTRDGRHIAVEIKRRGEIDGVEQLTRYLDLLARDAHLQPIEGVFAAQSIKPQARVLAQDRGIRCIIIDYDAMRGLDNAEERIF